MERLISKARDLVAQHRDRDEQPNAPTVTSQTPQATDSIADAENPARAKPADASTAKAVRLIWCDTGGIRRCRVVPGRRYAAALSSGVGITTACMAMPAFADCPAPDAGPAVGVVGEARLVPVESTRVALPWCPGHQAAVAEFRSPTAADAPWACCPRTALARTLELLHSRFGLRLKAGFELEFTLLERAPAPHPHLPRQGQQGEQGQQQGQQEGGGEGRAGAGVGGSGWRPVDSALYCQSSALDRVAAVLDAMVGALEAMGIGVLQWHAESAPGQFEIALAYGDALTAADQVVLAREALVGVAARHGLAVSFLPKPLRGAAGNGCHVHLSLWKDGTSCMALPPGQPPHADTDMRANSAPPSGDASADTPATAAAGVAAPSASAPSAPSTSSPYPMLSFLSGLLSALPALLPFTAPCPNSYDRLAPGCWAGAHAAWGFDNREAPLRLTGLGLGGGAGDGAGAGAPEPEPAAPDLDPTPNSSSDPNPDPSPKPSRGPNPSPGCPGGPGLHLEYKSLDGSANPHLALAAIAVAGMQGLASGSLPPPPCQVAPAELPRDEAARLGVVPLPGSLEEALGALEADEPFKSALVEAIGVPLLRAYVAVRAAEAAHADQDSLADLLLRYS